MLVLTRRIGQQILMNRGTIQLKVLKIDRGNISLGIQAPQGVDVDREEIYLKKCLQNSLK